MITRIRLSQERKSGSHVSLRLAGLFSFTLLLVGCASSSAITSTPYDPKKAPAAGIVYSLPKQLVSIKVVRAKVDYDKLVTKAQTAQAAHAEALKTVNASKAVVETLAEQQRQVATDNLAAVEELKKLVGLAQAELRAAQVNETKAKLAAQAAQAELHTYRPGNLTDTITLTLRDPVPDSQHTYIATGKHSVWRKDTVALTTSGSGLLQGYVGTAADQKGEVVLKAIEAVSAAMRGGLLGNKKTTETKVTPKKEEPFVYERTIDPTDSGELLKVTMEVQQIADVNYRFELNASAGGGIDGGSESAKVSGLVYRRPQAYELVVYQGGDFVQSLPMLLPNRGPLAYVEVPAGNFVTTEHDFAFKDGMLLTFKTTRPSEALAVASLVPAALKAIVAIPAEIVQFKIDYSSKEKALAETRKAELEAKAALAAQQKLDAENRASEDSSSATP